MSNCKGLVQDKGLYLSVFNTGILWHYILDSVCSVSGTLITFCYRLKTVLCNLQKQLHGKVVHTAVMSEDRKIICEFSPSISISCVLWPVF